jgi:peptidoglycan/xylan/chitin deacetylase (PgdA/CDA1 family)
MHWITIILPAFVLGQFYRDQKQNCTRRVTGSFCYTPGVLDTMGQFKTCLNPGQVALTFDDGPHPTLTPGKDN